MTNKTKSIVAIVITIILIASISIGIGFLIYCYADDMVVGGDVDMKINFDKSAKSLGVNVFLSAKNKEDDIWQQNTLPIGNGMLGGSIYGEVFNERIIFNEKTLWTGGPSLKRPDYNGGNLTEKDENGKTVNDYYQEVKRLFEEGKNKEASALCDKLVGKEEGYGAYQCWGEIKINMHHAFKKSKDYERFLSLDNAMAGVSYKGNDTTFKREYFASNPDKVLVIKLIADGEEHLSFDLTFPSKQGGISVAKENSICTYGKVEDNGLMYYSRMDVITAGCVTSANNVLSVSGAKNVVIVVYASTDYAPVYPNYRTGETQEQLAERVSLVIEKAVKKGYEDLRKDHIADYTALYDRVSFDLGAVKPDLTTDKLLKKYKKGVIKPSQQRYLEQLLYNYGRYLTIASSRKTDILPSNLQGLWNNRNNPPWASDYHMNVNLQMNYWPTYSTNLAECANPLVNYIDSLREPGRVTASTYAGIVSENGEENGFVFHTQNTPFGWTCPGWDFSWGWSPASTAWILQNVYEYYEYTGDIEYLRKNIYPMLREASLYFKNTLVEDKNSGRLVTVPTYSPEHGPRTMGNTYEQSLIWQLFNDTIEAGKVLAVDGALIEELESKIAKLKPIEIGENGQIKEWYHESKLGQIGQKNHRHLSHLLGLFPGDLINKDLHPEWLDATVVSLNNRGDKSTGWAMGQRINTWARVGDGDRAYKLIKQLFKSGLYSNMWDAHPPFQIDGNFGYTAGVTEMLMQSNLGYIELLPSLPREWANGKISGIIARGNFELAFEWKDSKVIDLEIKSNIGGKCILKLGRTDIKIMDSNFLQVPYVIENGKIKFETQKGMVYKLV